MTIDWPDPPPRPLGIPRNAVWFSPGEAAAIGLYARSTPKNWGELRIVLDDVTGAWAWTTTEVTA